MTKVSQKNEKGEAALKTKLTKKQRAQCSIAKIACRFEQCRSALKQFPPEVQAAAAAVTHAFKTLSAQIVEVPDTFFPARMAGHPFLPPGTKVQLRVDKAKKIILAGLVAEDEVMTVVEERSGLVVVALKDGTRGFFPRGHVCPLGWVFVR